MKKFIILSVSLILLLAVGSQPLLSLAARGLQSPVNFNGDEAADLVIGVPYEAIGSEASAGAAHVLYGEASTGLSANGSQLWNQGTNGLPDIAEANDEFGFALAIGDFNGDMYYDLAVGVHGEDIGNPLLIVSAGAVHIIYGTATGLSTDFDQAWHQNMTGILDEAEADDRFGYSLAAGDFNGDGYTDLAVESLWEDVGDPEIQNAGMVQILYGSAEGLSADGDQMFYQGAFNVEDTAEVDDMFGSVLTTCDIDSDGFADLAIGIPMEDVDDKINAGAVQILYGAATGLNATHDQFLHQDLAEVEGDATANDRFGHALAAGDSNGDGYCDLAVGIPYKDVGAPAITDAGAVHLFYGSDTGLSTTNDWMLNQNTLSVADVAEESDWFGYSLTVGNFDSNGLADLAVGVPGEDVGNPEAVNAGAVHIFYSQSGGENGLWYQGKDGVADTAEVDDRFGTSLAAGDFNADGYNDLAVGVPKEDREGVNPLTDAGIVHILYGSADGLSADGNQIWSQDSADIGGASEDNDRFGQVLAAMPTMPTTTFKIYLPLTIR